MSAARALVFFDRMRPRIVVGVSGHPLRLIVHAFVQVVCGSAFVWLFSSVKSVGQSVSQDWIRCILVPEFWFVHLQSEFSEIYLIYAIHIGNKVVPAQY